MGESSELSGHDCIRRYNISCWSVDRHPQFYRSTDHYPDKGKDIFCCGYCAVLGGPRDLAVTIDSSADHYPTHHILQCFYMAQAYRDRFNLRYCIEDHDRSLSLADECLRVLEGLRTRNVPLDSILVSVLILLGISYHEQWVLRNHNEDLDTAIELLGRARDSGTDKRASALGYLGRALSSRFTLNRSRLDVLKDGLDCLQESYHSGTLKDFEQACVECYLASALMQAQVLKIRQDDVLDEIKTLLDSSRSKLAADHFMQSEILTMMGNTHLQLYRSRNNPQDIDLAVQFQRQAYALSNPKHPRAIQMYTNMVLAHQRRYWNIGDSVDLDAALQVARHAVRICGASHPLRAQAVGRLTESIILAVEQSPDEDLLDELIQTRRALMDVETAETEMRAWLLHNLGEALLLRARRTGDGTDLDEAIHLLEQAVALTPNHTDQGHEPARYELSQALLHKHQQNDHLSQPILDSIVTLCASLEKTQSKNDYVRGVFYLAAGDARRLRYRHLGNKEDLDMAIHLHEASVQLRHSAQTFKHISLNAVAEDLVLRWIRSRDDHDVDSAMKALSEANDMLSPEHQDRAFISNRIGRLLAIPGLRCNDIRRALMYMKDAVLDVHRPSQQRLAELLEVLQDIEGKVVPAWSTSEDMFVRSMLFSLYEAAITLLPRVASLGLDLRNRMRILTMAKDLVGNAAVHAIALGRPRAAVELLDAGRMVFWTQLLRLRTPLDQLPTALAEKLSKVSNQLEFEPSPSSGANLSENQAKLNAEKRAAERRVLNSTYESLVAEARSILGDDFLGNVTYGSLASCTKLGKIVILLPGRDMSWAICIVDNGDPKVVQLPRIGKDRLETIAQSFHSISDQVREVMNPRSIRQVRVRAGLQTNQYILLAELWFLVMRPVIETLGLHVSSQS